VPGRGAQALPSFLTALPVTHLDVSACRAADLSVVAEMTSLVTLSLQVWPGPCRDRTCAPACARPPAACSLRPAADATRHGVKPAVFALRQLLGHPESSRAMYRPEGHHFQTGGLWSGV